MFTFEFSNLKAQIQINTGNNLNVTGEVYDILNFPYLGDYFFIVGNFNSINGVDTFNNIAFIKKSDYVVDDPGFINFIDGAIKSVGLYTESSGLGYKFHLYVGGDFTNINGQPHPGIAKFILDASFLPFNMNNFVLQTWNPILSPDSSPTPIVRNIEVKGDTLYYSGDFGGVNNNSTLNDSRIGVTAINPITNNDLGLFSLNSACNSVINTSYKTNSIKLSENGILVSGNITRSDANPDSYVFFNYSGCIVPSFKPGVNQQTAACCFNTGGYDIEIINDTIFGGIYKLGTSPSTAWFYTDTTNYGSATSLILSNHPSIQTVGQAKYYTSGGSTGSTTIHETSIESYKSYFYMLRNYVNTGTPPFPIQRTIQGIDSSGVIWNSNVATNFPDFDNEHLFVRDNKLFVSSNGNILPNDGGGALGTGLIAYCLEPHDAKYFTASDSTICPGDIVTYTIPPVQYADGYIWEYTGAGVDIGADDLGNEDLYDVIPSGNSVQIEYLANFSPGQLKVTPYTDCNNKINGDTIVSNTIITNIESNPLPNIDAGLDSTFTCIRDTIVLMGSSTSPNVVSYEWLGDLGNNTVGTDSTISINDPLFGNGPHNYIFKVVNDQGCPNYDTVVISKNITPPNISIPPTPWVITCALPSIDLTGNSTTNNVSYSWSDGTNIVNNQTVTVNVGTWNLTVTDNINGCTTTDGSIIETNFDQPNVTLINYPTYTPTTTVDILDCYNPSLTIVCSSDTANTVANWVDDNSGTNPIGDTKTISIGDTYYVEVENLTNGCKSNQPVVIGENFTQPTITMPISNTLNCSRDTVVLDGSTISLDTTLVWNGPTYTNIQNPLVSNQLGWHYFTVTKADNGCSKTDSINVVFEPTIEVVTDNDTLICNKTDVTLNTSYLGTLTNVNYAWNNGSNTATSIYNSDPDTMATVIVTADGGCIGYDTVRISIPNPPTITTQSFTPCDGGASGKIIVTPTNGLSPYTYAINSGTFQSASLFENLSIGTYTITVADSINCQYATTAEITDNGTLPEPLFIFSTYNVQADTVVLVDVSTPPADNIDWDFPFEISVLDDSNINSPVIILPDTGAFQITMNAHYGTCIMPVTKWIYSADYDTTLATNYNQNGIKSVELYPNPNSGVFTVEIEFYKRQLSVTTVQDMNGYSYYWQENNEDNLIVTHNIDLGSTIQPGTYVLKVASEYDSYYITFIVNQ